MTQERRLVPPIKCQGIKTKLTDLIGAVIPPDRTGTWIEPFVGSGVVAFNIRPRRAILADTNPHLIRFYQAVNDGAVTATSVRQFLSREGAKLHQSDGTYYYEVRQRFNESGCPHDFLFLNRACFNGLMRFNRAGRFNVPFCRKPHRFSKGLITKIVNQVQAVAEQMRIGQYEFRVQPFDETIRMAQRSDFIYCDPPYVNRHADYFNGWDEADERELAAELAAAPCRFALSTWHHNRYRDNAMIDSLWSSYRIVTREHFYHIGAKERNRNSMVEALVLNYGDPGKHPPRIPKAGQPIDTNADGTKPLNAREVAAELPLRL